MKILMSILSVLLLVSFTAVGAADEVGDETASDLTSDEQVAEEPQSLSDRIKGIEDSVNPADWKIHNGCVMLRRIKRIKFVDDQTAILSMRGKKKVILRLQRNCPGIKSSGFMHQTVGSRLCAGFDRFVAMGTGYSCRVGSLEPYIELEKTPVDKDLD